MTSGQSLPTLEHLPDGESVPDPAGRLAEDQSRVEDFLPPDEGHLVRPGGVPHGEPPAVGVDDLLPGRVDPAQVIPRPLSEAHVGLELV